MAIKTTKTISKGIVLPEAYIRISSVECTKTEIRVIINTYANEATRLSDPVGNIIEQEMITITDTDMIDAILQLCYIAIAAPGSTIV